MNNEKEKSQQTINASEAERQLPCVGNNFKETDGVAKDDNVCESIINRLISRFPDSTLLSDTYLLFTHNDKQFAIHADESKIYNISKCETRNVINENLTVIWNEDLSEINGFISNSLIPYNTDSNISVDKLLEMIN